MRRKRYVSGPGIGKLKQVQKLPNVETFGLKNIPFLATSRFCHYWQILLPDALWRHRIPYLIVLWCCQNWLRQSFIPNISRYRKTCAVSLQYSLLHFIVGFSFHFEKSWIFAKFGKLNEKPNSLCKLIYRSIKIADVFAKYGKHLHVKAATVYPIMCSRIIPKLAKLGCDFLPKLASIMKNQNSLYISWYVEV